MKIIIEAQPKEIADLVLKSQSRSVFEAGYKPPDFGFINGKEFKKLAKKSISDVLNKSNLNKENKIE